MVTLQDIADKARVHRTTVSRALKNHPGIPPSTRERILALAHDLGYRPNPLVTAYQTHVRAHKKPHYQATLGWVNDQTQAETWRTQPWMRGFLTGATQRAEALGFHIEEIRVPMKRVPEGLRPEADATWLQRTLRNRGIPGVILPFIQFRRFIDFDWSHLAVVTLSRPVSADLATEARGVRLFHSAEEHLWFNARLSLRELHRAGYTRVGLVVSRWLDTHQMGLPRHAILFEQELLPPPRRIPPLVFDTDDPAFPFAPERRTLSAWLKRHKPDALLCYSATVRNVLESLGLRIPQDLALAHGNLASDVATWTGIDPRREEIGAAAVDLLSGLLNHNERGVPHTRREMLLPGRWVTGQTT